MSFLKSVINQVGRDAGRVISNQVFKDAHSIPHRSTNKYQYNNPLKNSSKESINTDFEKAIAFNLAYKSETIINKLQGCYIILKNHLKKFEKENFLSESDNEKIYPLINRFTSKLTDVVEILEIDPDKNKNELKQLDLIIDKFNKMSISVMKKSAEGFKGRSEVFRDTGMKKTTLPFLKYIFLHVVWLGKYARQEQERKNFDFIFANIADIITFTFLITRPFLILKGIFTYRKYIKQSARSKQRLIEISEESYENYINFSEIIENEFLFSRNEKK